MNDSLETARAAFNEVLRARTGSGGVPTPGPDDGQLGTEPPPMPSFDGGARTSASPSKGSAEFMRAAIDTHLYGGRAVR